MQCANKKCKKRILTAAAVKGLNKFSVERKIILHPRSTALDIVIIAGTRIHRNHRTGDKHSRQKQVPTSHGQPV